MLDFELDEEALQVAADKKRLADEWLREAEDTRLILRTYGGRAFFWRLLEQCGVYKDSFRGEDTHETAHVSGKRSVGLWVLENIFTIDENAYTLMRTEAITRRQEAREKETEQE